MANWIPFTFENLLPDQLDEISDSISATAAAISEILSITATILEITATLVSGPTDALSSVISALITSIQNAINDFIATGFYALWHVPDAKQKVRKFSEWLDDLAESFDDPGDSNRPLFSQDAYVGGLVIAAAFPTFSEFVLFWKQFMEIFQDWFIEFNFELENLQSKDFQGNIRKSKLPDWEKTNMADWIPALKGFVKELNSFLDQANLYVVSINNDIQSFANFLQDKADALSSFVSRFQKLISSLIEALSQTGLYVLPIIGQGGNALLKSALQNRSGEPADIPSSDEIGLTKAKNALEKAQNNLISDTPRFFNQSTSFPSTLLLEHQSLQLFQFIQSNVNIPTTVSNSFYLLGKNGWWTDQIPGITDNKDIISDLHIFENIEDTLDFIKQGDPGRSVINNPTQTIEITETFNYQTDTKTFQLTNYKTKEEYPAKIITLNYFGNYNDTPDENALFEQGLEEVKELLTTNILSLIIDMSNFTWSAEERNYDEFIQYIEDYFIDKISLIAIISTDEELINSSFSLINKLHFNRESFIPNSDFIINIIKNNEDAAKWFGEIPTSATLYKTKTSYDNLGQFLQEYQKEHTGFMFDPVPYPDFAGLENYTAGCMLVTGGPSEASAKALFNLLGIQTEAGKFVASGLEQISENTTSLNNIFSNFQDSLIEQDGKKTKWPNE